MDPLNMYFLLNMVVVHCYISLPEGMPLRESCLNKPTFRAAGEAVGLGQKGMVTTSKTSWHQTMIPNTPADMYHVLDMR